MSELIDRLLILRSPGVGPIGYEKLVRQFGSVGAAANSLHQDDILMDKVLREIDTANSLGIHFVCDDDSFYPVYEIC